ncbi:MAG: hypothetical protein FWF04_02720, partial [Clostridiales bacterium]|nr:hypothetical protein [Clostridiales bacterium]
MSDIYKVTLETEILRELASSIDARYSRYLRRHGINWEDETNPVAANDREVVAAKRAMLSCETLEELRTFENRLKELRDIIEELEEVEKCGKKVWRGIPK